MVYDNQTNIKWRSINDYSDGNGIIFDSFNHFDRPSFQAYTGRILAANNLTFDNGGSGMHAFQTNHVDMVHNTSWHNSRNPNLDYPCIGAGSCIDVKIRNNIMVASDGERPNSYWSNTDVTFDYNIYYGGVAPTNTGAHDRVIDPRFVNATADPAQADFRLTSTSPAINEAAAFGGIDTDIDGTLRPQGDAPDIGAYEYAVPTSIQPLGTRSLPAAKTGAARVAPWSRMRGHGTISLLNGVSRMSGYDRPGTMMVIVTQ